MIDSSSDSQLIVPELPECCSNVLLSATIIQSRVKQLANLISDHYRPILQKNEQLTLVSILKGSYMFSADLARNLTIPNSIEFMAVSSYKSSIVSNGEVRIIMDVRASLSNKHVLIVEDIIDSGYTLNFLQTLLKTRSPKSITTCVLLKAPKHKRKVEYALEGWFGFDIGEKFVVGYGLDLGEKYRNLPYIAELKQSVIDEILSKKKE